jgi:predicted nucleotidyltransferase component of viral defense system
MTLSIAIHKNVLLRILKALFSDSTIGPVIGFKGGTAAYLFYALNRFSIDLDFDLLDESKTEMVFKNVKTILERHGTLKDYFKKRYSLFYILSYHEKDKGAQNVKVEINLRHFGSKYELKSYLGIAMKVMVKEDMIAHKLVALYERKGRTNRDLFDVEYFLRSRWKVNREIIELRTQMPFSEFIDQCISMVAKKSDRAILSGIGELLNNSQKTWVRKNLKKDTIFAMELIKNEL